MPFVEQPFMMVASQADSFQLSMNVGHEPKSLSELSYAQKFATATASGMQQLSKGCKNKLSCGMFSWNCYSHSTSLTNKGFDGATAGGLLLYPFNRKVFCSISLFWLCVF